MRLEDNYMSGIGASGLNRAQAADGINRKAGKGVSGAVTPGEADEVALSALTERLQGLSAHLEATADGSDAREAKLNELSALVAGGKYAPDAEQLGALLIDTMQAEKL